VHILPGASRKKISRIQQTYTYTLKLFTGPSETLNASERRTGEDITKGEASRGWAYSPLYPYSLVPDFGVLFYCTIITKSRRNMDNDDNQIESMVIMMWADWQIAATESCQIPLYSEVLLEERERTCTKYACSNTSALVGQGVRTGGLLRVSLRVLLKYACCTCTSYNCTDWRIDHSLDRLAAPPSRL
jgi:hypothetical protein